jgi:hypothetical protein
MDAADGVLSPPPVLHVVPQVACTQARGMDDIARESHFRMIRHHRRHWPQLQFLVDQACFESGSMERLPDEALRDLLRDLERAIECIREEITFEDAGLVRAQYL